MQTVAQALEMIFDLLTPVGSETVPLSQAAGRVLAQPAVARRDQPPFAAAAMDGYALRDGDAHPGARLRVVGESAAGHGFAGVFGPGETVRIFTGAPVPGGADWVVMQEEVTRDGDIITLGAGFGPGRHIRAAAADFKVGDGIAAPRLLGPNDLALLASMNVAEVTVARRPLVALLATGDELVMPGEEPGPDQIIASNSFGLMALAQACGASARMLPIARDNEASLKTAFALAADAELIVTIGGASVGDHDLVGAVAASLGLKRAFYKIAMRPGKPLMAGRLGDSILLGLPGNPVSSMVCGHVFMLPAIRALLGLGRAGAPRRAARLTVPLPANGAREHYMRARTDDGAIAAFERQDSALLTVLAQANALLIRPADDPARAAGDMVDYLPI
jgi:molybdopterin molybdotransferase